MPLLSRQNHLWAALLSYVRLRKYCIVRTSLMKNGKSFWAEQVAWEKLGLQSLTTSPGQIYMTRYFGSTLHPRLRSKKVSKILEAWSWLPKNFSARVKRKFCAEYFDGYLMQGTPTGCWFSMGMTILNNSVSSHITHVLCVGAIVITTRRSDLIAGTLFKVNPLHYIEDSLAILQTRSKRVGVSLDKLIIYRQIWKLLTG